MYYILKAKSIDVTTKKWQHFSTNTFTNNSAIIKSLGCKISYY